MKSPDNANKETCYCKPDFYGDSCENKRALAWGSRNPNGMGFQSDPGVPPNWDKLYQNIFMMSSFTLVALVIAMFMVGYFFGKSTRQGRKTGGLAPPVPARPGFEFSMVTPVPVPARSRFLETKLNLY